MSIASCDRVGFVDFATLMVPSLQLTPFHSTYYRLLDAFAEGRIRRLLITIPPQHGKSLGASVLLPAYLLGLDPDLKVAIASYSASLAQRFGKRVQRLIDSESYGELFPDTAVKGERSGRGNWVRTAESAEIVGRQGELIAVGREGSLTGNTIDVVVIDDLYKDAMEANSPTVRENCREWYSSVVRSREHNLSREVIALTRWHEEDIVGTIALHEKIRKFERWSDIDLCQPDEWLSLNLEALKASPATPVDPRSLGEPLWPERHSATLLSEKRNLDPRRFECMYQGRPDSGDGLLYGGNFATYSQLPRDIVRRANYTDTADTGDDYLCSVNYSVGSDGTIYIEDVVYSREQMEQTEQLTAAMLVGGGDRTVLVESNNGGRGFARTIARLAPNVNVEWFHQSANKEARILSNATAVVRSIRMPADWIVRWNDFARHLTSYNRLFRANRWHDAADVLTGIVEREQGQTLRRKIRAVAFW